MNIRFYHAKILLTKADHTFEVAEGELWVRGDHICYIGDGTDTSAVCKEGDIIIWDREIDAKGNLLMPGFKNAHTHTPMTFYDLLQMIFHCRNGCSRKCSQTRQG